MSKKHLGPSSLATCARHVAGVPRGGDPGQGFVTVASESNTSGRPPGLLWAEVGVLSGAQSFVVSPQLGCMHRSHTMAWLKRPYMHAYLFSSSWAKCTIYTDACMTHYRTPPNNPPCARRRRPPQFPLVTSSSLFRFLLPLPRMLSNPNAYRSSCSSSSTGSPSRLNPGGSTLYAGPPNLRRQMDEPCSRYSARVTG